MSGHTYKEAGVDIHEAAEFVGDLGALRARTEQKRKLFGAFGLFAAAYDLSDYDNPVLVTGCDGVGTKLEPLLQHDMLEVAGKDLVAMSVNDIITTGGDPLLFLDYLGVAKIERGQLARLVAGMTEYLEACGCILAGGETAEMPGLVPDDTVELSGFCVGAVEKADLIDPTTIAAGDAVVGFPSDSFHANGWSLVRRVLAAHPGEISEEELRALLAPTRLYHDVTNGLRGAAVPVKAHAHITGGGLPENLERLLRGVGADLKVPEWENAPAQKVLAHCDPDDVFNTFNMGFGWCSVVAPEHAATAAALLPGATVLGEIGGAEGIRIQRV